MPTPHLLAIGVLGAVSQFCHYQRTGRIELPIDELARFVGQWVVQALTAAPSPPRALSAKPPTGPILASLLLGRRRAHRIDAS